MLYHYIYDMGIEIAIAEKSFLKKGRMKESPFNMNPVELEAWEEQEEANVRNYLFSIGQPLVYKRDCIMVAEFADGSIKEL